jgi:hypothetical protein
MQHVAVVTQEQDTFCSILLLGPHAHRDRSVKVFSRWMSVLLRFCQPPTTSPLVPPPNSPLSLLPCLSPHRTRSQRSILQEAASVSISRELSSNGIVPLPSGAQDAGDFITMRTEERTRNLEEELARSEAVLRISNLGTLKRCFSERMRSWMLTLVIARFLMGFGNTSLRNGMPYKKAVAPLYVRRHLALEFINELSQLCRANSMPLFRPEGQLFHQYFLLHRA